MIRNHQTRRMLWGAAVSAGLLLMTVPAAMAGTSAGHAQEQHACAVILGLDRSEAGYDACIRSLDVSAQPRGNEAAACSYAGSSSTGACGSDLRATLYEENYGPR